MDRINRRPIAVAMHVYVSALIGYKFERFVFGQCLNSLASHLALKHRRDRNIAKCDHIIITPNEYPRVSGPRHFLNPYR
jgi:hypothetical protein